MKESLLLVFANKQDIPGGIHRFCTLKDKLILTKFVAMKPQEVTDALKLSQLKDKIWFVVPSCATTGEGLLEGLVYSPCPLLRKFRWLTTNQGVALQQRKIPTQCSRQEIVLPTSPRNRIRTPQLDPKTTHEHSTAQGNGERAQRHIKLA